MTGIFIIDERLLIIENRLRDSTNMARKLLTRKRRGRHIFFERIDIEIVLVVIELINARIYIYTYNRL